MQLSSFGSKFGGRSAIVDLMEDLGSALRDNPDMIFMGGGNPAHIDAVETTFQRNLQRLLDDPAERQALLGIYQSPQGDRAFRIDMAAFLRRRFGWAVSEANIAVSNGSQTAFFLLYNLLAGQMPDGSRRHIHLPLAPEYLGYADVGLSTPLFRATRPSIELLENHQFKYHVDFARLQLDADCAGLCVSRPTNPTGNVLTDDEMIQLDTLAREHDVPLIVDGAYGLPFPGILFNDATCHWNHNTVLVLSLSKLGLPGVRTGIVVAAEELIQAFANANTILSLASGNLGPALGRQLLVDDQLQQLTSRHITPFYREAAARTLACLQRELHGLPYRIHRPEGAIFLWLWFENLPIGSIELYQRLKARGVLVVPGDGFFVGIEDDWHHKHQCIRLSYAQQPARIEEGIRRLATELRRALEQG